MDSTSPKKAANRVSIPLTHLESDRTLLHVHLQKALKDRRRDVQFLKSLNLALIALIGLATLWLVWEATFGRPRLEALPDFTSPKIEEPPRIASDTQWPELERQMERRNIFEPVDLVSASEKMAFEQEILQRIRIVGVMLDQAPMAIIEIIATGETVFVSKDENIAGATVTDILENKVILTYNGTQLELIR